MVFGLIFGVAKSIKIGKKNSIFIENISNMFYSRGLLEVIFEAPGELQLGIQS